MACRADACRLSRRKYAADGIATVLSINSTTDSSETVTSKGAASHDAQNLPRKRIAVGSIVCNRVLLALANPFKSSRRRFANGRAFVLAREFFDLAPQFRSLRTKVGRCLDRIHARLLIGTRQTTLQHRKNSSNYRGVLGRNSRQSPSRRHRVERLVGLGFSHEWPSCCLRCGTNFAKCIQCAFPLWLVRARNAFYKNLRCGCGGRTNRSER